MFFSFFTKKRFTKSFGCDIITAFFKYAVVTQLVECHLAKVDVASPNLVYRSTVAPWPSGKAKLCKSFILQFDSGWRLQMKTQTKRLGLFLWRMAQSINRKRKAGV